MNLRDILVFLDAGSAGEGRLQLATNVARDHGASLSAVFLQNGHATGSPPRLSAPWLGATDEPPIPGTTVTYATRPDSAEQLFHDRLRSLRIEGDWKRVNRVDTNELIAFAQASDLVIIGQVRSRRSACAGVSAGGDSHRLRPPGADGPVYRQLS